MQRKMSLTSIVTAVLLSSFLSAFLSFNSSYAAPNTIDKATCEAITGEWMPLKDAQNGVDRMKQAAADSGSDYKYDIIKKGGFLWWGGTYKATYDGEVIDVDGACGFMVDDLNGAMAIVFEESHMPPKIVTELATYRKKQQDAGKEINTDCPPGYEWFDTNGCVKSSIVDDDFTATDACLTRQRSLFENNTSAGNRGAKTSDGFYENYTKEQANRDCAAETAVDAENGQSSGNDATKQSDKSCAIEGGLGWIACPIINSMASAVESGYGFAKNNFLNIRSSDMFGDSNDTAFNAWRTFRDIANVVFVILVIIVVLSQITGLGISNYGIKKILPRMFIVAILVNISWYISVIAVDISNIVGFSIEGFLSGLVTTENSSINSIANNTKAIIGGTGAVLMGAATLWFAWPTLGIALIGGVLSIITMIVILIARQALVILLVVISPLAIVMMLLPNTENYFTKWRKLFMAMLMVFPVCGLIMGGSDLASSILAGVPGGGVLRFTDVLYSLVSLLPMIATPMVIKKSLDGLGSIGGKIAAFGSDMGTKAQGAAKNTAAFDKMSHMGGAGRLKQMEYNREVKKQENAAWRKRGWAGARSTKFVDKANKKMLQNEELTPFEMSRMSSAAATLNSIEKDENTGDVAMAEQFIKANPDYNLESLQAMAMETGNTRLANGAFIARTTKKTGGEAEKAMKMVEAFEKGEGYVLSSGKNEGEQAFTKNVSPETRRGMISSIKSTIVNDDKVNSRVNGIMPQVGGWANSSNSNITLSKAMEDFVKPNGELSDKGHEDIAKMRPSVIRAGMQSGAISRHDANEIVNNKSVSESLGSDILTEMKQYAETGNYQEMDKKARNDYLDSASERTIQEEQRSQDEQMQRDIVSVETLNEIKRINSQPNNNPTPAPQPQPQPQQRSRPTPRGYSSNSGGQGYRRTTQQNPQRPQPGSPQQPRQ